MDNIFWTDTHAHIHDDESGRSIDEFIKNAVENNVYRCITVGVDYNNSLDALGQAEKYTGLYVAVGLHPEYADKYNKSVDYERFLELAKHSKVLEIGETGLDFYHDDNPAKEKQVELFEDMVDIACKVDKPIVIHSRNAAVETIEVLNRAAKKYNNLKGVFHCFDGSANMLKWACEHNFYISYAGNVTFKSAENLRDALKNTPLDRLLIETDSPYLAPVPMRGKKNMPAYVSYTAEFISNYIGIDIAELANRLEDNFIKIMGAREIWK